MSPTPGWFSDPANAASSAFAIAILSLGVSALAFLNSRKAIKIEEAREKDRLKHSEKANLKASLKHIGPSYKIHELLIENEGVAEARNLAVKVNNKPVTEHPAWAKKNNEVNLLGPSSHIKYTLRITNDENTRPPFHMEIAWEDDSGESGNYRTTLTI